MVTISLFGWAYANLRPDDRLRDAQPSASEAYQALAHCDQALGGTDQQRSLGHWSDQTPIKPLTVTDEP